jgi:hypothetical protein
MPPWSLDVRYWMNSGKHVLGLSFCGFDPKRTLRRRHTGKQAPLSSAATDRIVDPKTARGMVLLKR